MYMHTYIRGKDKVYTKMFGLCVHVLVYLFVDALRSTRHGRVSPQ